MDKSEPLIWKTVLYYNSKREDTPENMILAITHSHTEMERQSHTTGKKSGVRTISFTYFPKHECGHITNFQITGRYWEIPNSKTK